MKLSPSLLTNALKGTKKLAPGRYSDGRNLYLSVNDRGAMSWVFMWKVNGHRREMGLGSFTGAGTAFRLTLAEARLKADEVRAMLAKGIDPLEERRRAKRSSTASFRHYMNVVIDTRKASWKASNRALQVRQWKNSLETHAADLLDMAPTDITYDHVLRILKPIWNTIPKAAGEVRNRIEIILDRAADDDVREGPNPAIYAGRLERALGAGYDADAAVPHAAMEGDEVPAFIRRVQGLAGMAPKGMIFAVLNANRASEAREMMWAELDLDRALWTIPASRMKGSEAHVVPLSTQAVELLRSISRVRGNPYVFAGQKDGQCISASAFRDKLKDLKLVGEITMHGFRASFRTWASQRGYSDKVAEVAIAHKVGSKVTRAYDRDDLIKQRRAMLQAWADHCFGKSNVVTLREVA